MLILFQSWNIVSSFAGASSLDFNHYIKLKSKEEVFEILCTYEILNRIWINKIYVNMDDVNAFYDVIDYILLIRNSRFMVFWTFKK